MSLLMAISPTPSRYGFLGVKNTGPSSSCLGKLATMDIGIQARLLARDCRTQVNVRFYHEKCIAKDVEPNVVPHWSTVTLVSLNIN